MDPVTIVASSLAVVFALLALLQWRRAADLEERVRELEAKLTDALPASRELAPAPAAPRVEGAEEAEGAEEEREEDEEDEDDEDDEDDDEAAEDASEAPAAREEPKAEEPKAEEAEEPPLAAAPPEPAPKAAEPDPLRLEALKVVADAFELARYLDFDAIVEKPSTYRVTVPLTAVNSKAVHYLQDGMFNCLKQVRIEETNAILHIDTSKGPP